MKKLLSLIISVCLCFSLVSAAFAADETAADCGNIKLIAHRGMNEAAPENSIPAIEKAGENGFYGVEFDVQVTKDRVPVLSHDILIDRLTNGNGEIKDLTYDEIMQFHYNMGNYVEEYEDLKIATAAEALEACAKYGLKAYIEIKNGDEEDMRNLVNVVKEKNMLDDTVFISFYRQSLDWVKACCPEAEIYLLIYQLTDELIDYCLDHGYSGISLSATFNGPENAKKVLDSGLGATVWTVNDTDKIRDYAAVGVEIFTTDNLKPAEKGEGEVPAEETQDKLRRTLHVIDFVLGYVKVVANFFRDAYRNGFDTDFIGRFIISLGFEDFSAIPELIKSLF